MNLTNSELIEFLTICDLKASAFENKIINNTDIEYSEIDDYTINTVIVLLSSMKLNHITIDEMLEKSLKNLHK